MNKEEKILGKFETQEELVKAYSALQSEFTRRSQKLSQLKKQAEKKVDVVAKDEMSGYSRTKVLASKPKEFEK